MKIAFAGGAFAEVAGYYAWSGVGVLAGLDLERVGCTGRLGDLSCQGR